MDYLEETPAWLSRRLEGASEENLRAKPPDGGFSILEHVCHLRDIEREAYGARIRRMLEEDEPFLADVDGDRLARERDYQRDELVPALAAFSAAREENVAVLRRARAGELARRGTLEGYGAVTLRELASLMKRHDEEHREALDGLCREP